MGVAGKLCTPLPRKPKQNSVEGIEKQGQPHQKGLIWLSCQFLCYHPDFERTMVRPDRERSICQVRLTCQLRG